MTAFDLTQLFWLNREIHETEMRLDEIRARAMSDTATLTGMPSSDTKGTRGNREHYMILYSDIMDKLCEQLENLWARRSELMEWLNNVSDSLTRQALTYRYFDGMSWRGVARKLGGGNTAESVRKMCSRYIAANCERV